MGPPKPDDTGTTTTESDQHLPAQPAITPATGPGRTRRATCAQLLLLVPPANRPAPGAGPAPMSARRRARRRSRRGSIPAAGLPSTLSEPGTAEPTTIASPPDPNSGSDDPATRRPPRHIAPDAPRRGRPRRTDACQDPALCGQRGRRGHGHRRRVRPDTRIAPVAWTPVAWTPDVRPTHWTDVRPADSGRGQATNGVSGVRTSSTATATGGWAGPTPLGLPRRRRSAIHDGSAVTTPAAAAVTTAAPGSRTAPHSTARHEAAPRRIAVVCWSWRVRGEGNGTTEAEECGVRLVRECC
jgi:hypothetical protein